MKKIMYFHGFGSSGASGTVDVLRRAFWGKTRNEQVATVVAPDIPVDPSDALPYLKGLVAREAPDLIIGTSMGGMYAQQMRGVERICVNPSFETTQLYSILFVGRHKWLNTRQDGELYFHITKETIAHFAEMEAHQFDDWCEEDTLFCHGLFGDADELTAGNRAVFEKWFPGQSAVFAGGHRLNADLVKSVVLPKARELLFA